MRAEHISTGDRARSSRLTACCWSAAGHRRAHARTAVFEFDAAGAREHPADRDVGPRRAPLQVSDAIRPVNATPLFIDDRFVGRVLMLVLQSRPAGIYHELERLLSLPSTLLLMAAAVVVALVVLNPARRRLVSAGAWRAATWKGGTAGARTTGRRRRSRAGRGDVQRHGQ